MPLDAAVKDSAAAVTRGAGTDFEKGRAIFDAVASGAHDHAGSADRNLAVVALCGAGRHLAGRALAREAATLGGPPDFAYVFPEPLGPHRWRGVLRQGDLYRVYLVHSLSGQTELKEELRTQFGDPRVEEVRHSSFGRRLEAFFKAPVWRVEGAPASGTTADTSGVRVSAYDLRFLSLLLARRHVFEYTFRVGPAGQVGRPTWRPEPAGAGNDPGSA